MRIRGRPLWIALGSLTAAAAGAAVLALQLLSPANPDGTPLLFTVPEGATLREVAGALEQKGLVRSTWPLVALARLRRVEGAVRAGEYELSPAWSSGRILAHLVEGRARTHEVRLPEGLTAREIAARFEAAGIVETHEFLAVVSDPTSPGTFGVEGPTLEGYLFPETYRLSRGLSARSVVRTLVGPFLEVWRELAEAAAARDLSMQEVATLASIIEKETADPAERPLIASVLHNRLARGMRLESDPTVIYGIAEFDGNLKRAHLEDATNPYNTYRNRGLPPTPIANAGRAALAAVVEPADSDYLYFVSRNDGTHEFSKTYREHEAAVDRHQRRRRQP